MSKAKFSAQAEKLKNLVDSARLQTSSSAVTATAPSQPNEGAAHAELKATSKTSLDFSSYIIEAIREKLERDGAIGQ